MDTLYMQAFSSSSIRRQHNVMLLNIGPTYPSPESQMLCHTCSSELLNPITKRDVLQSAIMLLCRATQLTYFNRRVIGCVAVDRRSIFPPRLMVPPPRRELDVIKNSPNNTQRRPRNQLPEMESKSALYLVCKASGYVSQNLSSTQMP